MKRPIKYAILIVIVLAIAGGIVLLTRDKAVAPTKDSPSNSESSQFPDGVDIVYTGYSFTPDDFALAPGATVTIINESGDVLEFASDPHPSHDANPALNIGSIASGERKSFQIAEKGAWGYHNVRNPLHRGRIVVFE
jgi:hypothetical protein